MHIEVLNPYQVDEILARASLGRLACAKAGQPYISTLYFVADGGYLYGFTTMGQKVQWMRENPRVCVSFEEMKSAWSWTSIIVTGSFEELGNKDNLRDIFA